MLQSVNQFQLLQSMDKDEALARARVYQQTNDPTLIATGKCMEQLLNASPADQMAFLCRKTTLNASEDVANAVISTLASTAMNAALPSSGTIVEVVSGTLDAVTDIGSVPEKANNVRHSADTVRQIYGVYEDAMAAYESNPTQENLQRATDAYETYQQACANSMQAYNDLCDTTSDYANSGEGPGFQILQQIPFPDNSWMVDQAESHRMQANEMDAQMDAYMNT